MCVLHVAFFMGTSIMPIYKIKDLFPAD